jgi:hypothetical protein
VLVGGITVLVGGITVLVGGITVLVGGTEVRVDGNFVGAIFTETAVAGIAVSVTGIVGKGVCVIVGSAVYEGVNVSLFGKIVTTICGKIDRFSVFADSKPNTTNPAIATETTVLTATNPKRRQFITPAPSTGRDT